MQKKVREWPKVIEVDGGIICNPTPEECTKASYVLLTPEEIEAEIIEEAKLHETN